jgi:hypothetical protein
MTAPRRFWTHPRPALFVNTGYSVRARHLVERIAGETGHNSFALDRTFVPPRGKTR